MNHDQTIPPARQLITYSPPTQIVQSRMVPALDERGPSPQENTPLTAYLYVLLKRRWTILSVAGVLTAIAVFVSFRATPIYEATARLEIDDETPQLQSSSDVYQKTDADDVYLQTQIQVLESENLAWQTIQQFNLAQHLNPVPADKAATQPSDRQNVELIGAFRSRLKVEQVPRTRMLAVSFQDPDPKIAAQVATGLVNGYLEYNFRQKDE